MKFFWCQEVFFVIFDFKNESKYEFLDNKDKSYSWFKNKVGKKIDFRADGTHESHPWAWELNKNFDEARDIFSDWSLSKVPLYFDCCLNRMFKHFFVDYSVKTLLLSKFSSKPTRFLIQFITPILQVGKTTEAFQAK